MIWGKTKEQKEKRKEELAKWHKCYALMPVCLENGRYAWFERVWGRMESGVSFDGPWVETHYSKYLPPIDVEGGIL